MSYSITKADLEKNREDILNIWEKNYPGIIHKKFEWIYHNNPAGSPRVWLVRHEESGEYVGVTALFPRRFVIDGKTFKGGIAGDLLVNRDHRSAGPALKLQRSLLSAIQDGTVDFVYGFPNKASEPILKRAGYKVWGERVRLVKLLKTAPKLSRLHLGNYWASFLSPAFDFLLKLISAETWSFRKNNFICEEVDDFDEGFDQLWRKTIPQFMVTGERVSRYLRWRFLDVPNSTNKIFALFDKDKRHVRGYIIYQSRANSIEIKDFFCDQHKRTFSVMFASFLRYARSSGAQSVAISLLENKKFADQMMGFGFAERKEGHNVLIYIPEDILSAYPFLQDIKNWLLLQSDDDDI